MRHKRFMAQSQAQGLSLVAKRLGLIKINILVAQGYKVYNCRYFHGACLD
jgi:hypothetical protein